MKGLKKYSHTKLREEFRNVYLITLTVLILGLLVDMIRSGFTKPEIYIDLSNLVICLLSLILIVRKKCELSFCFLISCYGLLLNILITYYIHRLEIIGIIHLCCDTVYIAFILTLSAYFVNKYHAFIVAGIFILSIIIFNYIADVTLMRKFFTLMFGMASYSIIIYYFVRKHEKTLEELSNINFEINQKNEELLQQQEEISLQKEILTEQALVIIEKNKEMLDGIRFAKSIQESVLSKESDIEPFFKNYFVISQPKSMISGDFFWVKEWKGKIYMAVVDCTGHGVPGALVSMLANMYIGRAFIEIENPQPSQILNYINRAITEELRLIESFHARVGMDIAIVCIDPKEMTMNYSGAFSPLYIIRRDNLIQYDGTKIMIGILTHNKSTKFKDQQINLMKGDRFYLFSDGILDQFGQKNDKKFGYKRLRNALVDTNHGSMETQKELFFKKWLEWKGNRLQVDDALILGVEI